MLDVASVNHRLRLKNIMHICHDYPILITRACSKKMVESLHSFFKAEKNLKESP